MQTLDQTIRGMRTFLEALVESEGTYPSCCRCGHARGSPTGELRLGIRVPGQYVEPTQAPNPVVRNEVLLLPNGVSVAVHGIMLSRHHLKTQRRLTHPLPGRKDLVPSLSRTSARLCENLHLTKHQQLTYWSGA